MEREITDKFDPEHGPQTSVDEVRATPSGQIEFAGSETQRVIGILRNPYGHNATEIKEMQLKACDLIERWQDAYKNMQEFAEANGLDIVTHG